jgi:gamma-carbonic anhydrase
MVVGGRTVVTSCAKILSGKPSNLIDINRKLAGIAGRFPGAIIDRYYDLTPTVAEGAHVFPGAALIVDVRLAENVSVWYNCVVRGDINYVEIGCVPRSLLVGFGVGFILSALLAWQEG